MISNTEPRDYNVFLLGMSYLSRSSSRDNEKARVGSRFTSTKNTCYVMV
jgi:hypothetical protein